MNLVAVALIAQLQHIVRQSRHSPVVGAYNAFVVIAQYLASQFGKQAIMCLQLRPRFVDVQAVGLVASPRTALCCAVMCAFRISRS